jgi:hypothetical protein
MRVVQQPSAFLITKLDQHELIKEHLLESISKLGEHSIIEENGLIPQRISNTDWGQSLNSTYFNIMSPLLKEHCRQVKNMLKLPFNIDCIDYWFQQYRTGDYHSWHSHANCLYSNVYYLDLPEGSSKTTFKFIDEEFEVEVTEGDILTFPGSVLHCSKPNKSEQTKTVIAFNTR